MYVEHVKTTIPNYVYTINAYTLSPLSFTFSYPTVVTSPSLLSCTTTIQGNGSSVFSQNCAGNGSTPVYINFMPNSIVTNWMSYYVGPTPPPPFPAYINGFQVGINQSEIRTILSLLSSEQTHTPWFCASTNTNTFTFQTRVNQ